MKRSVIAANNKRYYKNLGYRFVYFADYDFKQLNNIMYITRAGKGEQLTYSDCLIMADTETSKSNKIDDNHICAWTLSIRAYNINIVTLYGHKPSEFITTLKRLRVNLSGNKILIYFHNLSYDWIFLERFLFDAFGLPVHQLNTKPFYPIFIEFSNGLELRDSYILSQKSLERWANDLDVEHKKAIGSWDYDKIRNQNYIFTPEELKYIEFDTLAGVECLQKTMNNLHKHIYSMPYTATGIVREEVRKRGRLNRAHDRFIKKVLPFDLQMIAQENVYHGGYTHCNRHTVNWIWDNTEGEDITAYDFASSYPFVMLTEKYPAEKFIKLKEPRSPQTIIENMTDTAFIFRFVAFNIQIKENVVMPVFQFSKCVKTINAILDNGRILYADYAEIWLNEVDLMLIMQQYDIEKAGCFEVYAAIKDYLPRWYTNYVFELFQAKTQLKGGDPVDYAIAKAKLNSLYGLFVQKPIKDNIIQDYETGEYYQDTEKDMRAEYDKYINKYTSILNYQNGIWITSYAMANLINGLGSCAKLWLYSDTDSAYSQGWDLEKLNAYNEQCKEKLKANGYGCVVHNGRDYWLGLAEFDGAYSEFVALHSKCYACRKLDGTIKLTVAGVPKKSGAKCLNNDLKNFKAGFIFDGNITGKKTYQYFIRGKIFIDADGNECGDSINFIPCHYQLSNAKIGNIEDLFKEQIYIEEYE